MSLSTFKLNKYLGSGLLGLHFTPEELFIGVCQRKGGDLALSALDCIDIRNYVLEGGEYDHLGLIPAINEAIKRHKIKTRKTVVSFPVKFPWLRTIEVPFGSRKEMDQIVKLEVERLYLDSTVEKLIDYHVLGDDRNAKVGETVNVLSCAIPRNVVVPYSEMINAAGLELVGIDLAEVSVLKMAGMQGVKFDEGITIILNVNLDSTDLMLMENNVLQLVRKVGQGKKHLRETLESHIPADSPVRDQLSSLEFRLPSDMTNMATDFVGTMLGEIRRSIEFYLTDIKRAEGSVTKVILAGSGYWPANLPEILSMQLHLPLVDLRFDYLKTIAVQTKFSAGFPALSVYAPVVGSIVRGGA